MSDDDTGPGATTTGAPPLDGVEKASASNGRPAGRTRRVPIGEGEGRATVELAPALDVEGAEGDRCTCRGRRLEDTRDGRPDMTARTNACPPLQNMQENDSELDGA